MPRRRSALAAFTLMEMLVLVAILAVILTAVYMTLIASTRAGRTGAALAAVQDAGRKALDRMADDLRRSAQVARSEGEGALPEIEQDQNGRDWRITIANVTGLSPSGLIFGSPITYRVEIDAGEVQDGIDNDRDGLADERRLVRQLPTTRKTEVLVRNIRGDVPGQFVIHNGTLTWSVDADDMLSWTPEMTGGKTYTIVMNLVAVDHAGRLVARPVSTTVQIRN